jgi:hypothetical protein
MDNHQDLQASRGATTRKDAAMILTSLCWLVCGVCIGMPLGALLACFIFKLSLMESEEEE